MLLSVRDGFYVSFSVVISIFRELLFVIASVMGVGISAEIKICGVSSDRVSISALTAAFIEAAGKSPTSTRRGHTAAHSATQA